MSDLALHELFAASGRTLATAESCTGGLIGHRITNIGGCSAYYLGGLVTYSNEAKQALLGVPERMLMEHGAVSEAVARVMAEGVRAVFGTDYGIGVTGIAGPGGGTAEKPVGLVYIGVSKHGQTSVSREVFSGDRLSVKDQTATRALHLLAAMIQEDRA